MDMNTDTGYGQGNRSERKKCLRRVGGIPPIHIGKRVNTYDITIIR
jgi:hypothetical protein